MADNETQQHERTEQPSTKRLDDARRQGQLPRSRELGMTAVMVSGAATLMLGRSYFANGFEQIMSRGLVLRRDALLDTAGLTNALEGSAALGLKLLAPLFVAVAAAAVIGGVALGGWSFSVDALMPKFERLDPLSGLKRVFGLHGVVELSKAFAKFVVVAVAAFFVLAHLAPDILGLGTLTLEAALSRAAWLAGASTLGFAATLVFIAAADVPYQYWNHRRQLKMTKQEAKEEHKETEGRPEVRSRIRALQRSLAQRRMMSEVPKADVIAMNPTHFAVALKYDPANMKAPRVVAKGADLVAFSIRRIAEAHNVPIFEHPQFARALYHTSELGAEISPRLYVAVAQVLTYIYQLRGKKVPGGKPQTPAAGKQPPKKPELAIDAELLEPARGRRPLSEARQ